ncbi:MAG: hypothetical protein J0M33_28060 [Anaerolineae bacterium]|nr:hypothetical protein [Anaerolineae bacterium]
MSASQSSLQVAVYPTSWAGEFTFEQLYADLAHYVTNVMKRNGIQPHQLDECLQIGMMALWEQLAAQPDFLTEKTRRQAVFFVLARCKISTLRDQEGRYDRLEPLVAAEWRGNGDEFVITGLEHHRSETWAAWATYVDMRVDIERIMQKLAAKYAQSFKHLVALYFLTTEVSRKDAAALAGMDSWRWYQRFVLPVQADLRYEFSQVFLEQHDYPPTACKEPIVSAPARHCPAYRSWREQYQRGHTSPAEMLAASYRDTPCIGAAIQAQIDGKTYTAAAEAHGRKASTFRKHMKRAARLLNAAYA